MNAKLVLLLSAATLTLTSCFPLVLGGAVAGGAAGGVAAEREGGLESAGTDARIKAQIDDKWFKYNTSMFAKLHTTVDEGRVLITGVVQNPDDRVAAVRLAWQVDGVEQVINEVQVNNPQGFLNYAQDKWITTRLRTELTFTKDVTSVNYSIVTVNGIVYLMGIAVDKDELNEVIDIARNTPHVTQVISYVKMQGEPIPNASPQSVSTNPAGARQAPDNDIPYDHVPGGAPPPNGPPPGVQTPSAGPVPPPNTVPDGDAVGQPVSLAPPPAPVQSESLAPAPVTREQLH